MRFNQSQLIVVSWTRSAVEAAGTQRDESSPLHPSYVSKGDSDRSGGI